MCTGVELAMVAAAAATTYSTVTAKPPKAPELPAPEKPPQAAKAPDAGQLKSKNASLLGPMTGNSSTLLTGPSGIDSAMLNLGRNKLLGS